MIRSRSGLHRLPPGGRSRSISPGKNIMGVPVPVIEKKRVSKNILERGYGIITTSARIDETAERYEVELDLLIKLAEIETAMRRLGSEIQMNRRRVNALEQILIPELKGQAKYIKNAIEEREREDLFRLRRSRALLRGKKRRRRRRRKDCNFVGFLVNYVSLILHGIAREKSFGEEGGTPSRFAGAGPGKEMWILVFGNWIGQISKCSFQVSGRALFREHSFFLITMILPFMALPS